VDRFGRVTFPVIATEIEFYLFGSQGKDLAAYWQEVRAECASWDVGIYKIEKEKGAEQHELALVCSHDVEKIIRDTDQLKIIITELAAAHDMRANFDARPLENEPGSGLHVHVHLEDEAGKNLYTKRDDEMSDALAHSIAGLLDRMKEDLAIFAPTAESKKRFTPNSNAPTTVSWGANNRTCAIRLPDKGTIERHIEHRVAGADADVGKVVEVILNAIEHGMKHKLMPPAQVHGDASLEMYALEKLIS